MTPTFEQQMARLGGLRFVPGDMTTHWEALQDLPYDLLVAAVSQAQRACVDFPTPFELRTFADLAKPHVAPDEHDEERGRPLATPILIPFPQANWTIKVDREWTYYCDVCSDMGTVSFWCGDDRHPCHMPWVEHLRCERGKDHGPHEWVRKCVCFDRNPTIQKRLERQRKYADQGSKKR